MILKEPEPYGVAATLSSTSGVLGPYYTINNRSLLIYQVLSQLIHKGLGPPKPAPSVLSNCGTIISRHIGQRPSKRIASLATVAIAGLQRNASTGSGILALG